MKILKISKYVILLAMPLMMACAHKQVRQIPLEDFFKNPECNDYKISPDGTYFSYMAPFENRRNIFIQKVGDTSYKLRLTSETNRDIAGYAWANKNRIIYLKDSGGDENYRLYGVNIDGSNAITYTPAGVRVQIVDELPDIDSLMIIETNERNPQIFDVYRLNLNTGKYTMVAKNPGNIQGWMTDHDGNIRVAYAIVDGVNTQILYRATEKDAFKPVLTTSFKESVNFEFFTPDNQYVYATTNLGRDKTILVKMDPATGKEIDSLYSNEKYDIEGAYYSQAKKKLISVSCQGHKGIIRHFFDADTKDMYQKLDKQLPNMQIRTSAMTKDENTRIIYAGNDKNYGSYYLYDVKTNKLTKISDLAPWLKSEDLSDMIPITYPSRDGLTIEAYLTLPNGFTLKNAKNLPVIINPHGGPWSRDEWGYNPEIQFLANRGYAVLQMNFRGSTGFGRKFLESSYKQWGQNMQNDITDGVNWLIEKGIANPKKIAIYGGSYGGYATLAGVAFTPDLYACAVDYVGVSNLFTFMNTFPPYWVPMREMMYEMVGNPIEDSIMLATYSPALHADKIKAPLFIAQGANDPRVNKDESDQMVEALKKRGIAVEYMVKDNEGHGFHNEENKFAFYGAMEKFLAKYLKEESKAK